jgi:predicted DsbA family dithiol-disulfide isomerase
MHEMLVSNRERLDAASIDDYARHLGLDLARFHADLGDPRTAAVVDGDIGDGHAIELQAVPAFLIDGRLVLGALPLEQLRKIVDEELASH